MVGTFCPNPSATPEAKIGEHHGKTSKQLSLVDVNITFTTQTAFALSLTYHMIYEQNVRDQTEEEIYLAIENDDKHS